MKLAKSTVFVTHPCNTKNEYTRILGIKKEPNGSNVKNNKQVIVIDCFQFSDMHLLFKIYKKVSFYSLHAAVENQLPAFLMILSLKSCR